MSETPSPTDVAHRFLARAHVVVEAHFSAVRGGSPMHFGPDPFGYISLRFRRSAYGFRAEKRDV